MPRHKLRPHAKGGEGRAEVKIAVVLPEMVMRTTSSMTTKKNLLQLQLVVPRLVTLVLLLRNPRLSPGTYQRPEVARPQRRSVVVVAEANHVAEGVSSAHLSIPMRRLSSGVRGVRETAVLSGVT
jgi:hypothetical protein